MTSALRSLLAGVLDYAGLFPPAKLPLAEAFANYLRYREGPERWLLGRFICPANRLADLAPLLSEIPASAPPLALSVLGQPLELEAVSVTLLPDLEAIDAFRARHGNRVRIEGFEVRLPVAFPRDQKTGGPLLLHVTNLIQTHGLADAERWLELPPSADWRATTSAVVAALPNVQLFGRTNRRQRWPREGLKLRSGGLEAPAFPRAEQVAFVIATCRDAGVPLKFTAGLHHPIRRFSDEVQTKMHGFVNVFVAGVLAGACGLAPEQVQRIVEDEYPGHFHFDEAGLRWQEHRASIEQIEAIRKQSVTSFGSCSFEEPIRDLRELGWWDKRGC